jgi:very-short-patch-repair endonuclease
VNSHVLWTLGATLVLALVAAALKPERAKSPSLNRPWLLAKACPQHIVLCQVQLLQMLRFKRGGWDRSIANRISQLSVDFVVVTPDTSIVVAVELDDSSHDRAERRSADARKAHVLKSAGIPLLRWHTRELPDASAIHAALAEVCLGTRTSTAAVGS